ncbi:S-adenosyl-L-methionine-dependent methyltransferase [Gloeophyllum trabeum ATCC 11539]|uniref:S-adenosyl-L-methionine-dependent methyltransferase n=1 Tax=Gloeophyllum trabeum (strain ATCC 11539 / FP-39264 / Madison 617) TaxID=670483 RepID=S7QF67_GLOTA|nr:S-adenosyl-L-methionine-dependent methyltransferase [Gloeophyllum trabeum ATCC 11539]EPQ58002.1 S-adenosyl-L-methionine-dependent methyltransferase [Gloeophyllum trabeum ATCC 11539]
MSSVRSGSPAPSLYSFHPSIDERLVLRSVHGRILNSQNETYMLPADVEEHQRLDLQHQIYTLMLGDLYTAPEMVHHALRPRNDYQPAIFDVGTGSGSWALDMAKAFPHCNVVGVDLAPIRVTGPLPENVRFEIDDANLGFAHYRQNFDVIHARAISAGIHDFKGLLREFANALRPGGVLLLADGEMQLYDESKEPLAALEPGEPGFTWTQKVFFAAYNAMKNRGGCIDSPTLTPRWLQEDGHFTNIGWNKIFVPIGPWVETASPRERQMAEMMRTNTLTHINGMAPLLLSEGYFPETVEKMQREAAIEVQSLRVHLYSRWNFAWAIKAA